MTSAERRILDEAMAAPERLLVVEEAFVARGPGVLLLPRFTIASPPRGTFACRLVTPDGRERTVTTSVEVAHMRGPLPPFAMYRLVDVTPDEVPPGSELWPT